MSLMKLVFSLLTYLILKIMKTFSLLFNWYLTVHLEDNLPVPVRKNGKSIGVCEITIKGKSFIGNFTLNEDIDNSLYVLCSVSLPNEIHEIYLEGILLVDYYDGLEKRAKKIENMFYKDVQYFSR